MMREANSCSRWASLPNYITVQSASLRTSTDTCVLLRILITKEGGGDELSAVLAQQVRQIHDLLQDLAGLDEHGQGGDGRGVASTRISDVLGKEVRSAKVTSLLVHCTPPPINGLLFLLFVALNSTLCMNG
jgi:hypothetical protein